MTYSYHDKLIIAHATLGSIAILILIPTAILLARYLRRNASWFKLHSSINTVAVVLLIITFALGTRAVASAGSGPEFLGEEVDLHHKLGLAAFVLVLVQAAGGHLAHYSRRPTPTSVDAKISSSHEHLLSHGFPTSRSPLRYLHIALGILVLTTLYVQVYTGFDEWETTSDAGTLVPKSVKVIYWVLLGLAIAGYIGGWVLEYKKRGEYVRGDTADYNGNGFKLGKGALSPASQGGESKFGSPHIGDSPVMGHRV